MRAPAARARGRFRRAALLGALLLALRPAQAQAPEPAGGVSFPVVSAADLKGWLTYLASDELDGRQVFTEGYGIAAQFIAERLREWGLKPLGDDGTYFQIVRLRSYKVERHSSVTIEANGVRRTFADGDHVTFPANAGGRQTLVFDGIELASPEGAGSSSAVRGRLVALVGPPTGGPRGGMDRAASAVEAAGAGAVIEYRGAGSPGPPRSSDGSRPDIAPTTRRVDGLVVPRVVGDDAFFDALLSGGHETLPQLQDRLARAGRLAPQRIANVKVTIDVNNVYEPLETRRTRNVVGMVEGTDPRLKNTYVFFGAHLDHVGYAASSDEVPGRVNNPLDQDSIWNGADDDGTGSTGELAIAKAFATGPKPRRSIVFLWHAGEEAGLYGSQYNADFPVVPLAQVQCLLNIDMIGRNRDNDPAQANSVFVIGADRISTDLHNLIVDTNATLPRPLTIEYDYNDPGDSNSFYTRSDQYSYAAKGVPVAFFFTGTHPDYHANSDSVDKILFAKQARIAQLVYEVGFAIADTDRVLRRDNRGPRAGRGFTGKLN